ncbi:hypothetical protein KP509_05G079900 [Ceratopteris richardii]|uniref:PPIase cyclophilin-type domain-containing protein n=1 Tax=Ceratopteris richardii TaxID=49495 RepID=A0A8T2USJ5_CERRI|nr:hypothetical protein KP509_05G079900 [Ceratopteris richardii]KAH7437600.1 hypothetical protein KP509_05G079900 [Ceratopteris richardii]KAH7437601.1 hypothetical protein KP509_05G079900 [Ceratopteris richardii]
MSSVYVLEPPTKGKVILNTTEGPLDIELWPKEAPKAVRNFVQLCVDGYYDDTLFHRIIHSFMIQGGDRSGTGRGGESIYGAPFADEFHSRLRFTHRGLLACANAGTPNSNNSQFFISLDRCDWLDRKNTIFGKVTGDTIYNLLKLGEAETGEDDRPLEPIPKILSVEVLWNPFDDIVPRQSQKSSAAVERETKNNLKKVKQLNLLSFGEEAEQEEQELAIINEKIKSSHDVLDDPRLLKGDADDAHLDEMEVRRRKAIQTTVREALSTRKTSVPDMHEGEKSRFPDSSEEEDDADFDAVMRRRVLEKRNKFDEGHRLTKKVDQEKMSKADNQQPSSPSSSSSSSEDDEDKTVRRNKLTLKKKGMGSEVRAGLMIKTDVDAQLLGPLEQQRHIQRQKKRARQGRETATLAKLTQFQTYLSKSKTEQSSQREDDDSGWSSNPLVFAPEKGKKDDMARNEDPDQYVVYDPLVEKGKEKFNKMQARLKRKQREWAGKSLS